MVESIRSTNNLINMISLSYQQDSIGAQKTGRPAGPPPPPQDSAMDASSQDPLGVFNTVDSNSDGFISSDEYETLTEGIQEITGNALSRTFADFDMDGDGKLNISELRSVLDVAGFAPPPPPPLEEWPLPMKPSLGKTQCTWRKMKAAGPAFRISGFPDRRF